MNILGTARKLAEAGRSATPGPWLVREYPDCLPLIKIPHDEIQDITRREDADFIALARQSDQIAAALLRAVELIERGVSTSGGLDEAVRFSQDQHAFLASLDKENVP